MGGGKGGGSGKALDYYGSIAGLICAGPVDELVAIIVDEAVVWPDANKGDWFYGSKHYDAGDRVRRVEKVWVALTSHTSSTGNAPEIGTGDWEELVLRRTDMGVTNPQVVTVKNYGLAILYWGTDDQTLDSGLDSTFAAKHPPYRRQCFILFKDFLFGRERLEAPNIKVTVRRAPLQTLVTGDSALLDDDKQANPIACAAEALTNPVFGLGQSNDLADAASWQGTADALTAQPAKTFLSPVLDRNDSFRSFIGNLLPYFDGWMRWNNSGIIEAGYFVHDAAPPTFTPATTIDFHDLVEEVELDIETWADTTNEAEIRFTDKDRAFTDGGVKSMSGYNRAVLDTAKAQRIERKWINRRAQASTLAAETAKIFAQPAIRGTLTVRSEKAESITTGSVFKLTHDAMSLSVVCRCLEKTVPSSSAGRTAIKFESDRALSAIPYQPTPLGSGSANFVDAEAITLYQLIQPPPALVGPGWQIAVLAARTHPKTLGLRLHFLKSDGSLFYKLGSQRQWAVFGTLEQDWDDTHPADGTEPADDTSEDLHVTFDASTLEADIAKISATQTEDAIDDDDLVAFIMRASDPTEYEVVTVRSFRVVGVETYRRFKVRRARLGTGKLSFVTGDLVFVLYKRDIVPYQHTQFATYAAAGESATFRLQSFNTNTEADITDTATCPDISFTFTDQFAPVLSWVAVQKRTSPTSAWTDITTFTTNIDPSCEFRIVMRLRDPNGDLATATIQATAGSRTQTLASQHVTGAQMDVEVVFTIPEGDWTIYGTVQDIGGHVTRKQLEPGGGGSPVVLQVHPASPTKCANPVSTPPSGGGLHSVSGSITFSCSTPSSTIYYQIVALGAAPGGSWTTYPGGSVTFYQSHRLYLYAGASGLVDSDVVQYNYSRYTMSGTPAWD